MEAANRAQAKTPATDIDYEDLEEMLRSMSRRLVDNPDDVTVLSAKGTGFIHFEVRCEPGDLGALIGKRGVHAEAMRTLLSAAAAVRGIRVTMQCLSREGDGHAGK